MHDTKESVGVSAPAGAALGVGNTGAVAVPDKRTADAGFYLSIPVKFTIALLLASAWVVLCIWLSRPWMVALSELVGFVLAAVIITFIAYVPGFMNVFLLSSIMLDRRPERRALTYYPDICVLVACYNEAENIGDTLTSMARQDYPGQLQVVVIDDGSTDETAALVQSAQLQHVRPGLSIRLLRQPHNQGKAAALNRGLAETHQQLVVTVDGDSWLRADALRKIVERYLSDPPNTVAVAGAVLVRNSRENWLTRAQEWDYFHGIAAVKRVQSMYQGTLVAQGAFSIYSRVALNQVGGWPDSVGEDIVLSWALLKKGARLGYCEDACLFTRVPDTLKQFSGQRQRWSRGLMEAFARHGSLLLKPRLSSLFVWWNLLFVPLDLVYTLVFIPGLILALFGIYWIAGPMTLLVLPLALIWSMVIFRVQARMLKGQELKVRRNIPGFLIYVFVYTMILQPICVLGYAKEMLHARKHWGTK